MGYSTCREFINKLHRSMGMSEIADDSYFSIPVRLDNYQRQTIVFLELVQKRAAIVMNRRFLRRRFTFPTNGVDTEYEVDYKIEGFKANSFFNVTASGPTNGPIKVMTYEQWRERYPRPEQVGRGFPLWLIPLDEDGTDTPKVMLFPYPAAAYAIEGCARIDAPDITDGAQLLIFPKRYDHALFYKMKVYLEQSVNEGRAFDWVAEADQVVLEVLADALGADEEVEAVNYGVTLWRRSSDYSTRDYNPQTDIVPPFNP